MAWRWESSERLGQEPGRWARAQETQAGAMTRWAQLSGASQEVLVHWSQPQMHVATTRGALQILLPGSHPQNAVVTRLSPSVMIYVPKTIFHHHQNCAHESPCWLTLLPHSQDLLRPAAPQGHCPVHWLRFFNPRQGSNRQPGPQSVCEKEAGESMWTRRVWTPPKSHKGEIPDYQPASHPQKLPWRHLLLKWTWALHLMVHRWPGVPPPPSPQRSLSLGSCIKGDSTTASNQGGMKECPHGRPILEQRQISQLFGTDILAKAN